MWFRPTRLGVAIGRDDALVLSARDDGRAGLPSSHSGASDRRGSSFCNWLIMRMPSRSKRAAKALPTPQISVTGRSARNPGASASPITEKPRGLREVRRDLGEEFAIGEAGRNQ